MISQLVKKFLAFYGTRESISSIVFTGPAIASYPGPIESSSHCISLRSLKYTRAFEKSVDSPYYSESELCGGAVTVSFSKYLP